MKISMGIFLVGIYPGFFTNKDEENMVTILICLGWNLLNHDKYQHKNYT